MVSDQRQRMWNRRLSTRNQQNSEPELEVRERDNDIEKNRCANASPLGGVSLQACW